MDIDCNKWRTVGEYIATMCAHALGVGLLLLGPVISAWAFLTLSFIQMLAVSVLLIPATIAAGLVCIAFGQWVWKH